MANCEHYFDYDSINSESGNLFTNENMKIDEDKLNVDYTENGQFKILIELCGKFIPEKFKVECHNTSIGTLLFKFFIHTEKNPNKSIFSSIEEGEFFLTFEVHLSEIMIKKKKYKKEYDSKNGILTVIYDINDTKDNKSDDDIVYDI